MSVSFKATSKNEAGVRIVPVEYHDAWARAEPGLRREVTIEIENVLIPQIEAYIESRGRNYKRGEANEITENFFAQSDVIDKWRKKMPTAEALYPLQKPENKRLADGTPFDETAERYFPHSLDGEGLRSRAAIMSQIMYDYFSHREDSLEWGSLACGAAVPVFDAASRLYHEGREVKLYLADIDRSALEFARRLAKEEYGISSDLIELEKRNILRLKKLQAKLGLNRFDAIDILGFFEYLPSDGWEYKKAGINVKMPGAIQFLNTAYRLLKPGGLLVLGNMRDSHRQVKFATQVVQWPYIRPRSINRVTEIIEMAGIDKERITFYLAGDGVYSVVAITK